jgi:hypothetical protein
MTGELKKYKYIEMVDVTADSMKTKRFMVMNKAHGDLLGEIKWEFGWRQYVFAPSMDTIFSVGCMEDIISFIAEIKEAWNRRTI